MGFLFIVPVVGALMSLPPYGIFFGEWGLAVQYVGLGVLLCSAVWMIMSIWGN